MSLVALLLLGLLSWFGLATPVAPVAGPVVVSAVIVSASASATGASDSSDRAIRPGESGAALATSSETANAALPRLTVWSFLCPTPYTGPAFAADCISPVADIAFTLTRFAPDRATGIAQDDQTGVGGSITFPDLTPAFYEVRGGPPGEFVQNAISCHQTADPTVPVLYFPQDNQTIRLGLAAGDDVTCTWYSVPEDLRGDG